MTGAIKVFFDGGCRPNPGEMETAVVARGILHHRTGLGHGSSEQAEWLALLDALQVAKALGATIVEALGDSASVINQATGTSKCRKPELRRCLEAFEEEACHFASLRVRHVKRTQNLAGIALARARAW
jgi:ribonuclease HI